jgi:hypothetical protein
VVAGVVCNPEDLLVCIEPHHAFQESKVGQGIEYLRDLKMEPWLQLDADRAKGLDGASAGLTLDGSSYSDLGPRGGS